MTIVGERSGSSTDEGVVGVVGVVGVDRRAEILPPAVFAFGVGAAASAPDVVES
jgi:hypothetical protein